MKILHIASDEKFINSMYWQFETIFPGNNEFVIFLDKKKDKPKYVSATDDFIFIKENRKGLELCLKKTEHFDLVILHGLMFFQSQIVLKTKYIHKFVWFFWGGEIYDNPNFSHIKVLGEKTGNRMVNVSLKKQVKNRIRPLYYLIKYITPTPELSVIKAAKRIKHFGIIHREEIEFLKPFNVLHSDVSHIKMSYYPLEFIFEGIENLTVTGEDILLGNSASLTNNHLEAFDLLKKINLDHRKLMVPLSYGDPAYAEDISEVGKQMFHENFQAITAFIPLKEYNKLLQKCSIVIMNHYRQQAVGNIVAMLWMGAKVYLDERNSFYQFLKRKNIHVFSIDQDLRPENEKALNRLEADKVAQNRQILKNELSFDVLKIDLKNQLMALVDEY